MNIETSLTKSPKPKPNSNEKLGFGDYFTDHMFVMKYNLEKGWNNPKIIPYAPIPLDPAAMCLHYGQEVFEGLKAYKTIDGEISLFRPDQNFKRLNISNDRMCIPEIDESLALDGLKNLINIDNDWIPEDKDTSLYIRPFIIATDPHLGVRPSSEYLFVIIMSPVGSYYPEGINPVKIFVETEYVRSIKGGTGFAKTAANYAASLKAQEKAKKLNFTQVLWLDAKQHKYIEEVGTMNVFFVIENTIITPSLDGSILSGITRMSAIELLSDWGYRVEQRKITIDEVVVAYKNNTLKEIFGTGTAAVISPVGLLKYNDFEMIINDNKTGEVAQKLYDTITGIQYGKIQDNKNWLQKTK